jgi:hypothetical protein
MNVAITPARVNGNWSRVGQPDHSIFAAARSAIEPVCATQPARREIQGKRKTMTTELRRRDFLKTSAAFAGLAAAGFSCVEVANAAPIQAPTVD